MAVDHLLMSVLLLLVSETGFSAEISVFVRTGGSVQLDIQTPKLPQFDVFVWRNDTSENIVKYVNGNKEVKLFPSYKDRVSFNDQTFSLTLMKMQKTDSGVYTAKTNGDSEDIIATYRVSVIDAVEAPVLTVNSISSSSDSCTVNFTCRGHDDLMINNSYHNNRCSSEEVTSHEYTLIIHCTEESIICNYSNPVSWKVARINITLCAMNESGQTVSSSSMTVAVIVFGVVGLIAFSGLILYCCCKNKTAVKQAEDTDYDDVKTVTQRMTGDTWTTVTYCTAGPNQTPSSAQ